MALTKYEKYSIKKRNVLNHTQMEKKRFDKLVFSNFREVYSRDQKGRNVE